MTRPDQNACPICNSLTTFPVVTRPAVPVHQNLLFADQASARAISRGRLSMRACGRCGFGFNAGFDPSLLQYGDQYDNTQTHSSAFNLYVDDLVRHLVEECGIRNRRVVEVGCGKGGFIRKIVEAPGSGNVGFGFDPTYLGLEHDLEGRLRFSRTFYNREAASVRADAVVCRHVIEHVADPLSLLTAVREAIGNTSNARIFFETPCLEWILRNQVVWDFFYEHCSLFTLSSLERAFGTVGFNVTAATHVFGGQYLWIEGECNGSSSKSKPTPVPQIAELVQQYCECERSIFDRWKASLEIYRGSGPIAVWGAGAKGVTFCNLADPDCRYVSRIVDVNPNKQGKFLAGTGHPIVAPNSLVEHNIQTVLVLNPNYLPEISETLNASRSSARVVNLMEAK